MSNGHSSSSSFGQRPHDGGTGRAPVLAVGCPPALEAVPGEPVELRVAVRNDGSVPLAARLDVAGFATGWAGLPAPLGPLVPGQVLGMSLRLLVPPGHPASELAGSVRAQPLDPATGVVAGRPASAGFVLRVAETGLVEVSMPDQVHGSLNGRFEVLLRNRGQEAQLVRLAGSSPAGAKVRCSQTGLRLAPGASARVEAAVEHKRALMGEHRRVPFTVTVKARGVPVTVGATFVQAPWARSWLVKAMAMVATVIAFAALAVFAVVKLSSHYGPKVTQPSSTRPLKVRPRPAQELVPPLELT